ncbi:Inward rectifier potassium channel 2 [Toxocara canis]|uniref:Inward rectifier potassium channel 2 n=1 Tax=Toxocara canis TaxID=6265 RepID=A0A0B2UP60_TOXCA|nr:Inward rectifier potassium channel 2 [Toxocara canis]
MENNNGALKAPMLVVDPPLPRLVSKDGKCLLRHLHVPHPIRNTYRNWFHLIIEYSWRFILIVFAGGFLLSWVFFGLLYYIIVLISGDLKHKEENKQCIANVHSFVSAFLFSLESQHTIGYGYRYMTEVCPPAFLVLCVQLIIGVLLQTMLAGIVVAKVLRPKKRRQEIRFSRVAVVGPVDDHDRRPTLMIRIADIQKKLYLAESHVRLYMACSRINRRGQRELIGVKDMNVGYDSGWDRVLLLWPIIVRHVIDEQSPLYGLTRDTLQHACFELIMTVEGIVEATGMTFQARTSFLPSEIIWGHRFTPMVVLNEKVGQYEVQYNLFEETEHVNEFTSQSEDSDDEHSLHNASGFV